MKSALNTPTSLIYVTCGRERVFFYFVIYALLLKTVRHFRQSSTSSSTQVEIYNSCFMFVNYVRLSNIFFENRTIFSTSI